MQRPKEGFVTNVHPVARGVTETRQSVFLQAGGAAGYLHPDNADFMGYKAQFTFHKRTDSSPNGSRPGVAIL